MPLRKVCRRPETEQRLQLAREVGKLSNKDTAMDRPLNGTPNLDASQLPPTTPATPVTGTAINATHLPGTSPNLYTPVQQGASTPGLQPMQPIPMQSLATPDTTASTHQLAAVPPVAPVSILQGAAPVSSSQGPTLSMPIAAQSTTIQQLTTSTPAAQQILPSIESSISRQLTISAPVEQQSRPNSAGVEPSVTGDAQQTTVVSGPAVQHTGAAETSNLIQPMEIVSDVNSTPAVDPTSAAPATTVAEVGLPSGSNAATAPTEVEKSSVNEDLPTTS